MLKQFKTKQRLLLTAALMSGLLGAGAVHAQIDSIHFLIPATACAAWY